MNQNPSNNNQVAAPSTMDLDKFSEDDIALAMALSASAAMPPFATANRVNETGTSSNNPSYTQASTDGSQTNEIRLPLNQNYDNNNQADIVSNAVSDIFSEEDIALAMALSASIHPKKSVKQQVGNASEYPFQPSSSPTPASEMSAIEYIELDMAIRASIQSAAGTSSINPVPSQASTSGFPQVNSQSTKPGFAMTGTRNNDNHVNSPSSMANSTFTIEDLELNMAISASIHSSTNRMKIPSAPPLDDGAAEDSLCVICSEAPIEGACVPCGHMVSCMSCLNEIKAKTSECPICQAIISQIIRIFNG